MEIKSDVAPVHSSVINAGVTSEIDLYEELVTFAGLPPDEQVRWRARFEKPSSEDQPSALCLEEELTQPESAAEDEFDSANISASEFSEVNDPAAFELDEPSDQTEPARSASLFNGVMSSGLCINCGALSEADDLFCASCAASFHE